MDKTTARDASPHHRREAANRAASRRTEHGMALSDIEEKLDPSIPHKTCAVCYHMAERGDDWAGRLRRLLSNRGVRFKDLAEAMADDPDEPTIPSSTLSRHAQRGCAAQEQLR